MKLRLKYNEKVERKITMQTHTQIVQTQKRMERKTTMQTRGWVLVLGLRIPQTAQEEWNERLRCELGVGCWFWVTNTQPRSPDPLPVE